MMNGLALLEGIPCKKFPGKVCKIVDIDFLAKGPFSVPNECTNICGMKLALAKFGKNIRLPF